jgi:hypothetical protein
MYPGLGEITPIIRASVLCRFCTACTFLAFACIASAQPVPAPAALNAGPSVQNPPPDAPNKPAESTPQGAPIISLPKDEAARPPVINLQNGTLTVQANNSDLPQILRDVAAASGMKIDGLNTGPRVFGVYGPGNSRDVLKELLVDSGYDFIMVGDAAAGAPRELLLTPQNKAASPSPQVNPTPPPDVDNEEQEQPQVEVTPPPQEPLGPGAIVPAPSPNSQENDNTRVQQTIQRLQHMQEQMQAKPPPPQ